MSFARSTKEVVSTKIVSLFAARPWLLVLLLAFTVSVATQGLLMEFGGGEVALEPGVMDDGDSNSGP